MGAIPKMQGLGDLGTPHLIWDSRGSKPFANDLGEWIMYITCLCGHEQSG
jgi:hypothetical protein